MASKSKKATNKTTKYLVKVSGNPDFVGIGAGGVQFSYGEATIESPRMAAWFKEHEGYEVTEIVEDEEPDDTNDSEPNAE